MTTNNKLFLVVLFSLAAVGLVVMLQSNPTMVILSILFAIAVVYMLNRFMNGRSEKKDNGYQRALRNQKKKGKMSRSELHKLTKLKRSSRDIPFKVISGGNKKGSKDKDKEKRSHM
ncbi:hypothetical protein [Ammoniphilus resinae]|uniref:Uncharacterized protein n=1 Tax=Ammoniphilus resinae TaxID=861532 RepID=A0ABS4GVV6_9BACL|nr:hypothetical protein [Ammoniphilus resinae]MBP1934162.1 hypothetical protein [Ammoniphilus resinae]